MTNTEAVMPEALSGDEETILREVGYGDPSSRSATTVLVDHAIRVANSHVDGVEVMSIQDALMRYDWVQDLMFSLIAPDENELLRQASELLQDPIGHFVYVHPGAKLTAPLQNFTIMERPQERQFTHNITVIGEGADVEMISGAAVPARVHAGHHVSIEETFVQDGASCRAISIEHWGARMTVDSYSRSKLGAGAQSVSNQVMLSPISRHRSDTQTWIGADASCNDQAIMFAAKGTERVFDTQTTLTAPGARSESIARMVSAGGTITNDALLIGDAPGTNGFLGCDGLLLSSDGEITATPALKAKSAEAVLSHEASVGMIDKDKLAYLMASGLDEDRARDLIVQGFLNLKDDYIPDSLRSQVTAMIASAQSGGM
ncbi:MAG: SufD family Fe-S cluster assembly protein [Pseudomonadota bacterium]